MLEQWHGYMIILLSYGPMFILMDWEYFHETVGCRAYKTVNKELDLFFKVWQDRSINARVYLVFGKSFDKPASHVSLVG